jgi:hypothetical protein
MIALSGTFLARESCDQTKTGPFSAGTRMPAGSGAFSVHDVLLHRPPILTQRAGFRWMSGALPLPTPDKAVGLVRPLELQAAQPPGVDFVPQRGLRRVWPAVGRP